MGFWGKLTAPFHGQPSAPGPHDYVEDPNIAEIRRRGMVGDTLYLNQVRKTINRTPGFSEEDLRALYEQPAEQSQMEEQASLRDLNRTAAATGKFGGGGTAAGRGAIKSTGMRTRAGLKQQQRLYAAQAALKDLYDQLGAVQGYATSQNPKQEMGLRESLAHNQFNLSQDELAFRKYLGQTEQYNKNYDDGMKYWSMIASAAAGCWVAEAIFGKRAYETHMARWYVLKIAPAWFRVLYLTFGRPVAAIVRRSRSLQDWLRPVFIGFAKRAEQAVRAELR